MERGGIRPIDPGAEDEIDWVARGMRQTLIEVEGEAAGTALYTLGWLRDRVRFHLDAQQCTGQVWVAEAAPGVLLGHTIVRVETDDTGRRFGLFSTTYVAPAQRRGGWASQLLRHGEAWMRERGLPEAATWTSATNTPLIRLYARHGYAETADHVHEVTATRMVRLARPLA